MTRRWAGYAQKASKEYWETFPKLDRIHGCHVKQDSHPTTDPNLRHSKDEL